MRIGHTVNLTISSLRHHLFGPGRFNVLESRRISFTTQKVSGAGFHRSGSLRHGTPFSRPSSSGVVSSGPRRVEAWPFDTAFPSALPKVALFPGQQLTDMLSSAAQLAKPQSIDTPFSGSIGPVRASGKPGTADHLGTIIDVFA